jgi:uncharacterized protein YbbC (DUF1343 family)
MNRNRLAGIAAGVTLALACAGSAGSGAARADGELEDATRSDGAVRPGITVLLQDSSHLIDGKRVGLLTNQTGLDERGRSAIDLLYQSPSQTGNGGGPRPRLVALFAPEHGIRGTEDRQHLASERDARTGVPIHSLYGATTLAPPDSALRDLDVLIIDLQDLGTRTWTYEGAMVYSMRSAARNRVRVLVLDRPNPITGIHVEGPLLDAALAYNGTHSDARAAKPYAIYPIPLRHGMTMGELARFYNESLEIGADLHVIPMTGWRRDTWFDETRLPWVKPSPNMPSLTSALLYPGLVAFEGSNLSVGRGTSHAFQRVGAPWLDAEAVAALLEERELHGVRFEAERFTPEDPTDGKYAGMEIPGIRIEVEDRDRVQAARIGAALLWAIARTNRDSLVLNHRSFDERFGSSKARAAVVRGDDPDEVLDRELP